MKVVRCAGKGKPWVTLDQGQGIKEEKEMMPIGTILDIFLTLCHITS